MNQQELAKLIKDRVVFIDTDIKYLEAIIKYSKQDGAYEDAFTTLYISLQNSIYIELDKIFDGSGQHEFSEYDNVGECIYYSSKYSIYKLIEKLEGYDTNGIYHCVIKKHHSDIMSIRTLRDKYFAHYDGKDLYELAKNNQVSDLQDLLKCVTNICCEANPDLFPNTYASNARDFDDWCDMAITSIKRVVEENDKKIMNELTPQLHERNNNNKNIKKIYNSKRTL